MKKELLALLCLCACLLPAGAEKIQTRAVYELPVTAAGAGLWQSADPSRVAVDYVPPEGENPGAIRIRILQAGKTPVEVSGPEFKLEEQPEFVTSRRLGLSIQAWQKECGNGAVQFRIRQSNGRWAVPLRPRRDWDTVIDMPKPGTNIGFALLVNNADKALQRKMLRLFDGIASNDPTQYGKFIIAEKE